MGTIIAAPTAWTARPPIITGRDGATAQMAEPRVKAATPSSRKRLRPKWSASRPMGTSRTANAIA